MAKRILWLFWLFVFWIVWIFVYAHHNEDSNIQKWLENLYVNYYLNDFEVIESKEFGNYLKFNTKEDLEKLNDYLDYFEEWESARKDEKTVTALDKWEKNIKNFTSLRSKQKVLHLKDRYSSPAFASLLNENGYIEVDNVLYHDKGDDIYIVNRDKNKNLLNEKLFFSQKPNKLKKWTCENRTWTDEYDCDWDDVEWEKKESIKCHWDPTFTAWAELDHWQHYISWNERLYMRAYSWTLDCNHIEAFPQRKYTFHYEYDMKIKDYNWNWWNDRWSNSKERIATSWISIKLVSADDICLKEFDLNVTVETLEAWGNVWKGEYLFPKVKYKN